jgi:hypothetical protein
MHHLPSTAIEFLVEVNSKAGSALLLSVLSPYTTITIINMASVAARSAARRAIAAASIRRPAFAAASAGFKTLASTAPSSSSISKVGEIYRGAEMNISQLIKYVCGYQISRIPESLYVVLPLTPSGTLPAIVVVSLRAKASKYKAENYPLIVHTNTAHEE